MYGAGRPHKHVLCMTSTDADVIVAVHGAGLTNNIFMLPGSVLIEVFPWTSGWVHIYECQLLGSGVRYRKVRVFEDFAGN